MTICDAKRECGLFEIAAEKKFLALLDGQVGFEPGETVVENLSLLGVELDRLADTPKGVDRALDAAYGIAGQTVKMNAVFEKRHSLVADPCGGFCYSPLEMIVFGQCSSGLR